MFCTNCGEKIKDNEKFCTHCGAQIHDAMQIDEPDMTKMQEVKPLAETQDLDDTGEMLEYIATNQTDGSEMVAEPKDESDATMIQIKRASKVALLLFMICFTFPFLTVSCQGQNIATIKGTDLAFGFELMSETVESNKFIVASLVLAFIAIILADIKEKSTIVPVSVMSFICVLLLIGQRFILMRNFAEQGYNPDVVQIQYHLMWYVALLLGLFSTLAPNIVPKIMDMPQFEILKSKHAKQTAQAIDYLTEIVLGVLIIVIIINWNYISDQIGLSKRTLGREGISMTSLSRLNLHKFFR